MITGFDNYTINQPTNKLVSHLGLGSLWKSPMSTTSTSRKYSFISYVFLNALVKNIFKSGIIHRKNPFYTPIFFHPRRSFTLPHGITPGTILKFYRVRRIKVGSDLKLRSAYVTRNYRHYLDFAPVSIFILGKWCLLLACTYLPYVHRKSKPLQAFKVRDRLPPHASNSTTFISSILRNKLTLLSVKQLYLV